MNWVDIVVIVILAYSVIQGWRRGFILTVVSFIKWFVGFGVAKIFYKSATAFFINQVWNPVPVISEKINGFLYEALGMDPSINATLTPEQFKMALSSLTLPDTYRSFLEGMIPTTPTTISDFITLLADKMSLVLVQALGFLVIMLIAVGVFSILGLMINTVAKLPVLNELNRGTGLLVGGVIGLVTVYFLMAMVNFLYPLPIATSAIETINQSTIGIYFYKYNILSYFLNSFIEANLFTLSASK